MARASLSRRALLLGLVVATAAEARPASRFTFKPPTGWTDLLDNPPEDAIGKLHPALALQMLRDDLLVLAADLSPGPDGENSFMQVLSFKPGGREINPNTLPQIRDAIAQKNKDEELSIEVKSADIVEIGGADVARVVWQVKNEEGDEMRMAYLFPGGEEEDVMIVYGSSVAAFPRIRPLLEESARATTGAVAQPRWQRLLFRALPYIQIAGVIGLFALLLTGRRKKAPPPAPPEPADKDDEADDKDDEPGEKPRGAAAAQPANEPDDGPKGPDKKV